MSSKTLHEADVVALVGSANSDGITLGSRDLYPRRH